MKAVTTIIFISFFFFGGFLMSAEKKFVVVIDAGHGGKDAGAVRERYKEKDINLAVALLLGKEIEENHNDVNVIYTRKTDKTVVLSERAQIANKAKANLFISIHVNSTESKTTTAKGVETFILGLARSEENLAVAKRENSVILLEDNYQTRYEGYDPHSPESNIIFEFMTNKYMDQSLDLASYIQHGFRNKAKRPDRGVRQAGFLVLRAVSMPSVLVELGFINNSDDRDFLISKTGQTALVASIYDGFKKYKQDFDKKQGNTTQKAQNIKNSKKEFSLDKNISISLSDSDALSTKLEQGVDTTKYPKSETQSSPEITSKVVSGKMEYRVQFMTSPNKLPNDSKLFKGLSPVKYYKEGSVYKYTYGSSPDLTEINKALKNAKMKFKDSFIVKFLNRERIK